MSHQHVQFLRVKKLKGAGIVKAAARHNLREIAAELGADSHINPSRTNLNQVIVGGNNSDDIAATAKRLMAEADIEKPRKDAVMAVELVFSLSPSTSIDTAQFFDDCITWVRDYFDVPILSATAHYDEGAPHMHAILLPIIDGRMNGGRLVGNKTRLWQMLDNFHEQVTKHYSLTRQSSQKRHSATIREQAAQSLWNELKRRPELLNEPNFKHDLIELIKANPEPLTLAAGLVMPKPKSAKPETFAEIMTKPQKLEPPVKSIDFCKKKRAASIENSTDKNSEVYVSVDFQNSTHSKQMPTRRYLTIGAAA